MHLSGPGLFGSFDRRLVKDIFVAFRPTVRYDMIYQTLATTLPVENFKSSKKRKMIYDLYLDIEKHFFRRNSSFQIAMGIGWSGINSGFSQTTRTYNSSTTFTQFELKKSFRYPLISLGGSWQKNDFTLGLRMGYCWKNPTIWQKTFILPEVSLAYKLL